MLLLLLRICSCVRSFTEMKIRSIFKLTNLSGNIEWEHFLLFVLSLVFLFTVDTSRCVQPVRCVRLDLAAVETCITCIQRPEIEATKHC